MTVSSTAGARILSAPDALRRSSDVAVVQNRYNARLRELLVLTCRSPVLGTAVSVLLDNRR